jgi:hypothetical protein
MVKMTEEDAKFAIERNLALFAERGAARRSGDVEVLLCYRRSLSTEDRSLYDQFVAEGNHAGAAAQQVEIITERERPHGVSDQQMVSISL